jgi:hypothetical protein
MNQVPSVNPSAVEEIMVFLFISVIIGCASKSTVNSNNGIVAKHLDQGIRANITGAY